VKEYNGCKDVDFMWFMADREKPLFDNYAGLIDGTSDFYAIAAIEEMFTLQEAEQLKDWLDKNREGETEIAEARLPIASNRMALGAVAFSSSGPDYLSLIDCDLPVKALGYFDLRHHERVRPVVQESLPF